MILRPNRWTNQSGRVGWAVLMWLIGIPLPIILIIFLLRGCQ